MKEFLEGEVYHDTIKDQYFMVLATYSQNDTEIILAILTVEPKTFFGKDTGELTVLVKDFDKYKLVERI